MRKIIDLVKTSLKKIDGYWIESSGHPIIIYGEIQRQNENKDKFYFEDSEKITITYTEPILIYGIYEYPSRSGEYRIFGIDASDELSIEVNYDILLQKLKRMPKAGMLLKIEDENWIVVDCNWIYNKFIGKKRLQLICSRYAESVTSGVNLIT